MSEQLKAALIRALIVGLVSAASTALATWATTSEAKTILISTGTAFLAPFIARFGGEGTYDSRRAERGDVRESDVRPRS
jgi:hypothetical protein